MGGEDPDIVSSLRTLRAGPLTSSLGNLQGPSIKCNKVPTKFVVSRS